MLEIADSPNRAFAGSRGGRIGRLGGLCWAFCLLADFAVVGWIDLLIALIFLQNSKVKTLMAGLMQFKSRSTLNLPLAVSGLFMATIPIVLLFLVSQKFFTRGLLSGMVK